MGMRLSADEAPEVMVLRSLIAGVLALAFCGSTLSAQADELVMFQQDGCPYCAAWNRDIGKVYAKTDEAKLLPLRRVDIHVARPADLQAIEGIRFTPTFVVLHCGREEARIVGYQSDEQFWALLDEGVRKIKESSPCQR